MQGHDAPREIRAAEMLDGPPTRQGPQRPDGDITDRRPAVPLDFDRHGTQHIPAVGIRDRERQAAIGVPVWKIIHPLALWPRRGQLRRKVVERIAGEFHRTFLVYATSRSGAFLALFRSGA